MTMMPTILKEEGEYTDGMKTGVWKRYDDSGKLSKTSTFDKTGKLVKEVDAQTK